VVGGGKGEGGKGATGEVGRTLGDLGGTGGGLEERGLDVVSFGFAVVRGTRKPTPGAAVDPGMGGWPVGCAREGGVLVGAGALAPEFALGAGPRFPAALAAALALCAFSYAWRRSARSFSLSSRSAFLASRSLQKYRVSISLGRGR